YHNYTLDKGEKADPGSQDPMDPVGSRWIPVDPVDPSGSQWIPVDPNGSQWIPVDPSGSL
ncbi:unnamed protein product, partial [Rotaria sp. Silwood2]